MNNPRPIIATALAVLLVLGATACGGGKKSATTATVVTTTHTTTTPTRTTGTPTARSTPKPSKSGAPPLSQTPAKTLSFSGSGIKDIGKPNPLRVPTDSTIRWTNTGGIFQIIPASVHVQSPVNSTANSGTAPLKKGAYYGFLINAVGNWTIKIVPG